PRLLEGHLQDVTWIVIGGDIVATTSVDGSARIWDRPSGRQIDGLDLQGRPGNAVAMARDGRTIAVATGDVGLIWVLPSSTIDDGELERLTSRGSLVLGKDGVIVGRSTGVRKP